MTQSSNNCSCDSIDVARGIHKNECHVISPREDNKVLYCICYTVWKRGEWHARREYLHAEDQQRAKLAFAFSMPRQYAVGRNVEIQGIAPVVGVFEEQEKMLKGHRLDNIISVD